MKLLVAEVLQTYVPKRGLISETSKYVHFVSDDGTYGKLSADDTSHYNPTASSRSKCETLYSLVSPRIKRTAGINIHKGEDEVLYTPLNWLL